MKNKILFLSLALLVTACASESVIPLGGNKMQIGISTSKLQGSLAANEKAYAKAAQVTLDAGYDKFLVESMAASIGAGSTTTMQIKMLHNNDLGAKDAIDAKAVLDGIK